MNNKLHYWVTAAVKNALLLLLMCTVHGAIMYIGNSGESLSDIINDTIMFYYMMVSVAIGAVFCNATIPLMLDVVLSLGCTRRDAFKHINIFLGIFATILTLVFIFLGLISGKSILKMLQSIVTYIACLGISAGIGSYTGALNMKKGARIGLTYFFSILFAVLIPMAILFFSGTVNIMSGEKILADLVHIAPIVTVVAVILAILFYILGMSKMKKQLYIHEVRI